MVSTDVAVEDVHFRRTWFTDSEIAWRSTMAALSDVAAMGAEPLGILTAIVLPLADLAAVDALADGIGAAAREAGARILGGDLSRGPLLSIGVTVLGHSAAPVPRNGASPGDRVYVTGRLGGPARAWRACEQGARPLDAHRVRYARPMARIREGLWLAREGASAMLDVSDGLLADLRNIAAASRVRIDLDVAAVPVIDGATVRDALGSGEEYELAVTAPQPLDTAGFERRFGVPLTEVGTVAASHDAEVRLLNGEGLVDLPSGYDHFSL